MTLRSTLWITAVAVGSLTGTVSAQDTLNQSTHTYTRTYQFPPIGVTTTGSVQVSVLNIAADSSKGTKASCTGKILFANADGTQLGTEIPFTVGSGKIATGVVPGAEATALGGSVGGPSGGGSSGGGNRVEISASVQLTVNWPNGAPCSMLLNLETLDSTGVTHAMATVAVETTKVAQPYR